MEVQVDHNVTKIITVNKDKINHTRFETYYDKYSFDKEYGWFGLGEDDG